MKENITQRQEQVNREIDETYQQLAKNKDQHKALDKELNALMAERHHYALLSEISDRLEKLHDEGGARLFWGDDVNDATASEITERARSKVIEFDSRVADLQKRYDEFLASIQETKNNLESTLNEHSSS